MTTHCTPLLDNIETSGTPAEASQPLISKDIDREALSIFDIEKYKKLTIKTALSLLEHGVYTDWVDRGNKLLACGSEIVFNDGVVISANFCRLRVCPMCQRRKSLKTFSDFKKILASLSGFSFLHMVLTVPNCSGDELRATVERLNATSSRFFRIAEIKRAFKGVARFLEVSYNKTNNSYHPHFHCLVAVNKSYFTSRDYLSQKRLRFLWSVVWRLRNDNLKRTKDSFIEGFNLLDTDLLQLRITKADEGALPEIAKYSCKPLDLSIDDRHRALVIQTLYEALHNKRLVQTFGVFRGFDFDAEGVGDIDNSSFDKSNNVVYHYDYALSQYKKIESN